MEARIVTHLLPTDERAPAEEDLYFDFCHDLTGKDADNHRHVILRNVFLNRMASDPRVDKLFQATAAETGLIEAFLGARDGTRLLATLMNVRHDELFHTKDWVPAGERAKQDPEFAKTASVVIAAVDKFDKELVEKAPEVGKRMMNFVRDELQLPWPWLCMDLLKLFTVALVYSMMGMECHTGYSLRKRRLRIDRRIRIEPNCSQEEAIRKLDRFYDDVRRQIAGCRSPIFASKQSFDFATR